MRNGKITIILSWNGYNACCKFKRGVKTEVWQNMTREEQVTAVNTMQSMAEMFGRFIKQEGGVAK